MAVPMAYYTLPQARSLSTASRLNDHQTSPVWNSTTKNEGGLFNPTVYDPHGISASPSSKSAATAQSWRVISPLTATPKSSASSPLKPVHPQSVKHLTCYFWAKNGNCKWSDDDCLYAHHDTGKIANGPMQVEPGKPAVAGKNATTARPVYEDWRGALDNSNNSSSSRINPEIQEQIKYIAAKAKATGTGNDTRPDIILSQKRYQPETTSPVVADTQRQGEAPYVHVQQVKTLAQVTDVLTTVVQYSQELFDKTAGTLQYEAQVLEDIFNDIAPTPINGLYPPIPYLQNLLNSRRNILAAMDDLEKMGTALYDARVSITKDLEKANLMGVAPDWQDLQRSEGNSSSFAGRL